MTRHHWRAIVIAIAAGALLAATPLAQQQRDRATTAASRASIHGRVTARGTGQPVSRAIVSVIPAGSSEAKDSISDDEGRFAFDGLLPGSVKLSAEKPGYVPGEFGALQANRQGTTIVLKDGMKLDLPVELTPGAAIAGTILDATGQPVPGVRVTAFDPGIPPRPRPYRPGEDALSDSLGRYRLFGLAPGNYVVSAASLMANSHAAPQLRDADVDATLASLRALHNGAMAPTIAAKATPSPSRTTVSVRAPTFFPAVVSIADATRIPLGPGETRDGVDIIWSPRTGGTVSGLVSSSEPVTSPIHLSAKTDGGSTSPIQLAQAPAADGQFRLASVVAGRYELLASAQSAQHVRYGVASVDVDGEHEAATSMVLSPGARIHGTLRLIGADATAVRSLANARVRVQRAGNSWIPVGPASSDLAGPWDAAVTADGHFEVADLPPGLLQLTVQASFNNRQWYVEAVSRNGVRLDDAVVSTQVSEDIDDLTIDLSDQLASLSGHLESAPFVPATEYFVVIFPADAARWGSILRTRTARPATNGEFAFAALPAGDYLLAAVTDVTQTDLTNREFFADIAQHSVRISLADRDRKQQDLRIR